MCEIKDRLHDFMERWLETLERELSKSPENSEFIRSLKTIYKGEQKMKCEKCGNIRFDDRDCCYCAWKGDAGPGLQIKETIKEINKTNKPKKLILVHMKSGKEVRKGDIVSDSWGEPVRITDWEKPHKPSSTGRIYCRDVDDSGGDFFDKELFPSVLGCEWREVT